VIQEALTNACKHAHGEVARLTVRYEPGTLAIEVANGGAAAPVDGAAHGLAGMRERVATIGGSLAAGPRPGGGFLVSARLPTRPGGPA
jgi:signal transduction histidine kinase